NGKQILPISIDNKKFLEYEDKIVKSFDKLDEIQSEGVDIIRDRRKFLVNFAQTLLDELDIEKENQWKVFSMPLENEGNKNNVEPIITPISKKLESEKIENPNENV
ncbi:hypothetical protein RhiirA4_411931, partial [Rhizophagus irregularis]